MQSVQVEAGKIDGDQMDALLKRFERPLLQYATRILGDTDRARDVVQETFIKLQNENRAQLDHAPALHGLPEWRAQYLPKGKANDLP
jgi:DNA-directed RNA polymerase specialized sigma24 family protein